jgi:formylglycine-generating enzyme required for sulfatase activity
MPFWCLMETFPNVVRSIEMPRCTFLGLICVLAWAVASTTAPANPFPFQDDVDASLAEAQQQYLAAIDAAEARMLAAFDVQQQKVETDGRLKVDAKIKLIEQIQAERKDFEEDSAKLPTTKGMSVSVSEYRRTVNAAKTQCGPVFDLAAQEYVRRQDLVSAKAILAEKERFLNSRISDNLTEGFVLDTWASGLGDIRGVTAGAGGPFGTDPFIYSSSQRAVLRVIAQNKVEVFAKGFPANQSGRIAFDSTGKHASFGSDMFLSSPADLGQNADLIYRVKPNGDAAVFHTGPKSMAKGLSFGTGTAFGDFLYVINCGGQTLLRVDAASVGSNLGTGITCGSWEDDLVVTSGDSFGENAYLTDGVHGKVLRVTPAGASTTFAMVPGAISIAQGEGLFGDFLYVGTFDGNVVRVSPLGEVSPFLSGFGVHSAEGNFRGMDVTANEMWLTTDTGELLKITPTAPVALVNSIGMKFVVLPAGQFTMGSPLSEAGRGDGESQHRVVISRSFEIGCYEVTQAEYEQVMGKNPSRLKAPNNPVEHVSWDNAMEFCHRLSRIPAEKAAGFKYRLPTEAEWEYACRAKESGSYGFGSDESRLQEFAWFDDNSGDSRVDRRMIKKMNLDEYSSWTAANNCRAHAVGTKEPNHFGLYDMHGNLWEWCLDFFADLPSHVQTDPSGPLTGVQRSIRGGSFDSPPEFCRSSSRLSVDPSVGTPSLGFRVFRER